METVLEKSVLGSTVEQWAFFFGIILITVLVAKLLSLLNKKVIYPFTRKTENKIDDTIFDAVESPLVFAVVLVGLWFAIQHLSISVGHLKVIGDSYKVLVSLNITWFFVRLVNGLLDGQWSNRSDDSSRAKRHAKKMMPIIKRTVTILFWIIGIVTALGNIGVNVNALIGTLGLGGIAFALASQDTIKNIFGAFTIFADKLFSIGDTIKIDNVEGTVVDVGIRSTKIRNYDKRLITFPNAKLTDASIVNISAEPMRRVVLKLGLTYDTTPEKMNEAMNLLKEMPDKIKFVSTKNLSVNFTDFADSALVLTFVYFIEKQGDIGDTSSNVNMEILTSFNKAGLSFAYPSQTIYLEK